MRYKINYCNGMLLEIESDSLETVEAIADEEICYTQQPVVITDENGNLIAWRTWYGVPYSDDDNAVNPIKFGNYGFYDDWTSNDQ